MRTPSARISLSERGAISWVTALLLVVLVVGGYLAYVWGFVYLFNVEVKGVVQEYGNEAVKNPNDSDLVQKMVGKIRALQVYTVELPGGGESKQPVADVQPNDVTWERFPGPPPTLHVSFQYVRMVHFPILNVDRPTTMQVDSTMDISRPDWGSMR